MSVSNLWNVTHNNTNMYSPLTLNKEWSAIWRLFFITLFSTTGTIINGFFISSFFVEEALRRPGNVYLACVGLADMVVSAGIIPASGIVLISKIWEIPLVCYGLQMIAQASTYAYNLLFAMVAFENYSRLCQATVTYQRFISIHAGVVACSIYFVSLMASAAGVYLNMDYDYCTRENLGNYTFRMTTSILLQVIPFFVTNLLFVITAFIVHARTIRLARYKRSAQYRRDFNYTMLNLFGYNVYILFWLPYLIIVNVFPNTSDENYYNCVWLGLSRSIISHLFYSGLNDNFRRAFTNLFYYCFCKRSLNMPTRARHRGICRTSTVGGVRVHILHNAMYPNSPPRMARASRAIRDEPRFTSQL